MKLTRHNIFSTNVKYNVREDLINWAHRPATNAEYTLIIEKYHHGVERRTPKLVLGYEMGGVYQGTKKEMNRKDTLSRKSIEWSMSIVNGVHDHLMKPKFKGHLVEITLN